MPKILEEAIPNKFEDMSPDDFEHFVAQLFRDNGYQAEVTGYVGDYGNDVTITAPDGKKTAVQVKRYIKSKVSVPDVNQVLGGMQRYVCDKAMVVTTSDFTKPARSMEEQGLVEFISWKELEPMISKTYLDGKSHYEYFSSNKKKSKLNNQTDNSGLSLDEKGPMRFSFDSAIYNASMEKTKKTYTLVYFDIHNTSTSNLYFELMGKVTCITSDKRQVESKSYLSEHMPEGKFYAGVSQKLGVWFEENLLSSIDSGNMFIFEYKAEGTIHEYVTKISSKGWMGISSLPGDDPANEVDLGFGNSLFGLLITLAVAAVGIFLAVIVLIVIIAALTG